MNAGKIKCTTDHKNYNKNGLLVLKQLIFCVCVCV
jgi:hypothetical protein